MTSLMDRPLSLYSIPVIFFTAIYPGEMKYFKMLNSVGYNNISPRSNTPKNLGDKVTERDAQLLERMEGAHLNGYENLSIWFAAIIVGNMAGLSHRWLNTMSLTYVATRVVYNTVYIHLNHIGKGYLRTAIYYIGLSQPLRVLFKAAGSVYNRSGRGGYY